jgi:alkyl hydroperoxide reductase subunit F
MYDVVIVGGGPAGVSAGVYCARKKLKTLLIAETIGGQSSVSATIENWIGEVSIKGFEFAQKLEAHLRAQEIEIMTGTRVHSITKDKHFFLQTSKQEELESKAIIMATGGRHRHLDVPGEEEFTGKGVVYCSTCDAPFFREKTAVVVGAGNSGLEACVDLFPYANKIYLFSNTDKLGGEEVLQEEVKNNKKVEIVYNAITKEILGENLVTGIRYENAETHETKELATDGVFVEIGMIPNTDLVKGLVHINEYGEIVIQHRTCQTSLEGMFAAGDATDTAFRQNNISAGQGCTAALSAYDFIRSL